MTHRLLLDTSSLLYRAFFALPTSIVDADGRPVNAVRGYLDMTSRLRESRAPEEIVHVLDDDWRPAGRVEAWVGYKAARSEEPEELTEQFALLRHLLGLAGERVAYAEGWEADDAIGALVHAASDADVVEIVTGDRDLIQLVRDHAPTVRVCYTVKGVSELAVLDEAGVRERHGVPADRYVDYATLRGDPSDGLPGVSGVGEKTARDLVARYPDLDALRGDTASLSPKLGARIAKAGAYLDAMRAVVPVRRDVPVTYDPDSADEAALDRLAAERNLDGPVTRMREAKATGR